MSNKLFSVTMKESYKTYFVIANSFDEAERKAINHVESEKMLSGIFDSDGSLKEQKEITVGRIEFITETIIR